MKQIRFLHIPKTAGTSFTDSLARIYGGPRFDFSGNIQADRRRFRTLVPSRRDQLRLVAGHSPRITGIPLVDTLPTVTFLRDPIKRVKSFCQHVSEGKSPDQLDRFPPERFDLDEFLASGDVQLANFQTRMLLGQESYDLPQEDEQTLARAAWRVLSEDLAGFGLVEEFDKSLVLLRRKLGWQLWPVYRRLNVRDDAALLTFSDDQLATIRELNALDLLVYEQARQRLLEELERNADYVATGMVLFRRHQDLLNQDVDSSQPPVSERMTQDWARRLLRARLILQIEGVRGLVNEAQLFLRWLRL